MRDKNESGAAAVEYALLAVGIAAACIFTLHIMGVLLGVIFQQTADSIEGDSTSTSVVSPGPSPTATASAPPPGCVSPPCS